MTHLTAAIMVCSLEQARAAAEAALRQGADLVEYRTDGWADTALTQALAQIQELIARSPLPCIVTCRTVEEGGHYGGEDQKRLRILEHAGRTTPAPAYIDLELATYQRAANLRQKIQAVVAHPGQVRPTAPQLILSSHDFTGRPADLRQRVAAMTQDPACRVVKIVWTAQDLTDNLLAFNILKNRQKPTIALCMGAAGLPSRVLAKKFGGLLTFAALDQDAATAPGQPTLTQIKSLYRWDQITPATRVFGVIGWPVEHSLSPAIHNAGFAATGFDGVYLPLPIAPDYASFRTNVGAWLDEPDLHFRGASVTIPHKENLLRFVRERDGEVEELAQQIGAANTLTVRPDGSLYAANTDYAAALGAVCAGLKIEPRDLAALRVAVLGAGGAARAIVAGFAHHGATVVIYNRTLERAQQLAQEFDGKTGRVVAAPWAQLGASCCQGYINCTPVGMHPHIEATPIAAAQTPLWGPGTVVFDTIYNPVQTRLLRQAQAAGCLTIPGLEMFARQAVGQFQLWTGQEAPVEVFRKVIAERLGK